MKFKLVITLDKIKKKQNKDNLNFFIITYKILKHY